MKERIRGRVPGKGFSRGPWAPRLLGWYIKLPPLGIAQLRLAAAEHGITCSSLVRQAVTEWLNRRGYPPVVPAGWHQQPTEARRAS